MQKAAIYARFSTERQNENSIETQVAESRRYAKKNGMTVVAIYTDEAVSGMKSGREGLDELLVAASTHLFDVVIIYDQSRLSREIVAWFTMRNLLPRYNVSLHSVVRGEFGDLNDPGNFLMEGVEAVFNQMHVLTTRQKTKAGLRHIASQGLFAGGSVCLGYDVIDKSYRINEDEARIVRRIFEMYAHGESYNYILSELGKSGCRTKKGQPFGKNSLYSILTNERYIGTFTHGAKLRNPNGTYNSHQHPDDMIRIENAIPPIITQEVWDMVRKRIQAKKHRASNKAKVDYLLSGKIICGECGGKMCGENGRSYICSTKRRKETCHSDNVRKRDIEALVSKKAREYFAPALVDDVAQRIYESMADVNDAATQVKRALEKELVEVDAKIRNINNAIAAGIFAASTMDVLTKLEAQQAEIYSKMAEMERDRVHTDRYCLDDIKKVLHEISQSTENDKLLIALTVESVVVPSDRNKDIHVVFNPLWIKHDVDTVGLSSVTPIVSTFFCGLILENVSLPSPEEIYPRHVSKQR